MTKKVRSEEEARKGREKPMGDDRTPKPNGTAKKFVMVVASSILIASILASKSVGETVGKHEERIRANKESSTKDIEALKDSCDQRFKWLEEQAIRERQEYLVELRALRAELAEEKKKRASDIAQVRAVLIEILATVKHEKEKGE